MNDIFLRTALLLAESGVKRLQNSHVAVFGIGGVGSYTAEALVRSGIGEITLVDYDEVDITNINRQIPALYSNVGQKKATVMANRLKEINPEIKVNVMLEKYTEENHQLFFESKYDYVVDAIDMVSSKIHLISYCYQNEIKIISSMGMGNKLDPTKIEVSDINKTSMCPLAKVMRYELKKRGIKKLKVIFSTEAPIKPLISISSESKREVPGSVAFVPSVGGLILAGEVVKDIAKGEEK